MSNNDAMKSMTRGGQTLLHNLRMISQVLSKVLLWSLPVGMLISFAWFFITTDSYQRYIGKEWILAQWSLLLDGKHHQQIFIQPDGDHVKVYSVQIVKAHFIKEAIDDLSDRLKQSLWSGFFGYLVSISFIFLWLKKRGEIQTANKHIKGDYLGTVTEAVKIMRREGKLSQLTLSNEKISLPLFSEMQHFLFHGTTGSGKSTAIKELLDLIRRRGDRALIYDKSCNLVKQFYQPNIDKLMNPLDERGVDWSLWKECRDKSEFENYATAQIPMPLSTQDPFWINAARTIFVAAAYRMRNEENPKILPLLRYLLTADLTELQLLLKGTEAETLMSEKAEKTAISIKSVLATYLKSLCFIKEGDNPFSIREWIQSDHHQGWLFVSSLGNKHESVKPLITAWLDIGINELLSLPENDTRRIWFILDEVHSLHQLPTLTSGLSEARKFGGCFVIGLLSISDLRRIYGHDGASGISSLLNTRFMFREPDPDVANWSARNLGKTVIQEVREGISYGANTIRDGVSVNRVETEKQVIMDSEIMRLHDLSCYARLPGEYPITKISFPFINRPQLNIPFIPRKIDHDNLRGEVLDLTEELGKNMNVNQFTKQDSLKNENKNENQKDRSVMEKLFD